MSNSISFKLNYKNSDETRTYEIPDVSDDYITPNDARNKVIAINASLEAGTANTLANLFVSNDYDSAEGIGTLSKITDLKIKTLVETDIPNTSPTMRFAGEEVQPEDLDYPPDDQPKEDDQR